MDPVARHGHEADVSFEEILAINKGVLPPTINYRTPDPECDLDYVPECGRRIEPEWAVCNCIAFGSKNSALVVRNVS